MVHKVFGGPSGSRGWAEQTAAGLLDGLAV